MENKENILLDKLIDCNATLLLKEDVKKGDFFISSRIYSDSQRTEAMQVIECCDNVMCIKTKNGCMTKSYLHFEKVEDITKYKIKHTSKYFEDNRTL